MEKTKEFLKSELKLLIIGIITSTLLYYMYDKPKGRISEILQWNIFENGYIIINKQIENIKIYLERKYWNN